MLVTDVGDGLSSNTHGQDYFDLLKYGNVFIIFFILRKRSQKFPRNLLIRVQFKGTRIKVNKSADFSVKLTCQALQLQ